MLRRYQIATETLLTLGNLTIDQTQLEVKVETKGMILPHKEFELLSLLVAYPKQVFPREQLIEKFGVSIMKEMNAPWTSILNV